jgi:hypothetical protein
MDNQPLAPLTPQTHAAVGSSPLFSANQPRSGGSPILIILVILLGIGDLVFGVMAVSSYGQAQTATTTLHSSEASAADAAKKQQLKEDNLAATAAAESPFRAFTAPTADGSFVINFPKNWSAYVDEEDSGTDLALSLNPNYVSVTNSDQDPTAAQVQLVDRSETDFMTQYQSAISDNEITQKNITVSGISGFDLSGSAGSFDDANAIREVVVPVRDKVVVFISEVSQYATEFDEILAQAHINP